MNIFKVGTSITLPAASIANAALSAQVSLLGSDIASAEILDDTIANADINTAAAITKSKLAALNITDADVSSISGDKITGTIVSTHIVNATIADADINASAGIAATKINTGVVDNTEFNYYCCRTHYKAEPRFMYRQEQ
ncbi:MAG: hypothetical protein HY746_01470 [Elusimicrobia bacterium]|nr:hypothetical protein [Elusimicrobiota bacterium]